MISFKEALRTKDFVISAELPITPVTTPELLLADAELLSRFVDGFLITDYRYGQPHMSPLAAATILMKAGLDPIMQLNCRDRNRIALMGELLGAKSVGVGSLMLLRGRILPTDYKPYPTSVVDMEVKELIATAKLVNENEKFGEPNFLIGTSATVHEPSPDWHPAELIGKADAGAQFIVTQICLDVSLLRHYMDYLVTRQLLRRFSVIVTVTLFSRSESINWIRENRPRTLIPDDVYDQVTKQGGSNEQLVEMYGGLFRDIAAIPGISGINIAAVGDLSLIPGVLENAGMIPA